MKILAFVLSAIVSAIAPNIAAADDVSTAKALAVDWFAGRHAAVTARMTEPTRAVLSEDKLAKVMSGIRERNPSGAVETTVTSAERGKVVLACHSAAGDYTLTVGFDSAGAVVGLLLRPGAGGVLAKNDSYESKVRLRLPLHGAWTAHNAARNEKSHHYAIPSQRWAVDWLKHDASGQTHKGEGNALSDYYSYREAIVAPTDGTVVTVVDGIPENPAHGTGDIYFASGNSIVLQIADNEFALFCHLVPGSASVKVGQKVRAGELLGRVGNSGNSTEPHLHFQLMDKRRQVEALTVPAKFSDATLNGKATSLAWPDEGDVVVAP